LKIEKNFILFYTYQYAFYVQTRSSSADISGGAPATDPAPGCVIFHLRGLFGF